MKESIVFLLIANTIDFLITIWGLSHTHYQEMNILLDKLMKTFGIVNGLLIGKGILITLVISCLLIIYSKTKNSKQLSIIVYSLSVIMLISTSLWLIK
jgi:hypothetical protein